MRLILLFAAPWMGVLAPACAARRLARAPLLLVFASVVANAIFLEVALTACSAWRRLPQSLTFPADWRSVVRSFPDCWYEELERSANPRQVLMKIRQYEWGAGVALAVGLLQLPYALGRDRLMRAVGRLLLGVVITGGAIACTVVATAAVSAVEFRSRYSVSILLGPSSLGPQLMPPLVASNFGILNVGNPVLSALLGGLFPLALLILARRAVVALRDDALQRDIGTHCDYCGFDLKAIAPTDRCPDCGYCQADSQYAIVARQSAIADQLCYGRSSFWKPLRAQVLSPAKFYCALGARDPRRSAGRFLMVQIAIQAILLAIGLQIEGRRISELIGIGSETPVIDALVFAFLLLFLARALQLLHFSAVLLWRFATMDRRANMAVCGLIADLEITVALMTVLAPMGLLFAETEIVLRMQPPESGSSDPIQFSTTAPVLLLIAVCAVILLAMVVMLWRFMRAYASAWTNPAPAE